MKYKIGSFNLKNLGLSALSDKSSRDLELLSHIIKEEGFDVVALQEILSEGKALGSDRYAEKSLLMHLGSDWDFRWASAESSLNDTRNEGYAFVWNTRRLRLATARMQDGSVRTYNPRICEVSNIKLSRKPYYARFTPANTLTRGPFVELRLLCIHAYYGSSNGKEDIMQRQKEMETIFKDIYPEISNRIYQDSMVQYTVVLGDYNLELKREDRINKRKILGIKPAVPFLITDEYDKDCINVRKANFSSNINKMSVPADRKSAFRILTTQDQLTTLKKIDIDNETDDNVALERGYVFCCRFLLQLSCLDLVREVFAVVDGLLL